MDPFQQRKNEALAAISSSQPDKSPKGFLDAPIIPLIDAINLHPSFFTTSSCSGRISILSQPNADSKKTKKKKAGGGTWVYISHAKADADEVVKSVFDEAVDVGDLLVFRFEPLIVAIECRSVEAAQFIVSNAISCGFRESGITSIHRRIIVAIRCSIRMEVPLGHVGSIMVSKEFVRYLAEIANEKMETNKKRTDGLLLTLQSKFLSEIEPIGINCNKGGRIKRGNQQYLQAKYNPFTNTGLNEIDAVEHHDQNRGVEQVENEDDYVSDTHSIEDKVIGSFSEESLKDLNLLHELESRYKSQQNTNANPNSELLGTPGGTSGIPECSITVDMLKIAGEPADKIFLWGQSAGILNMETKQIIVFGGFGGIGRHARRNYSLTLDSQSGQLNEIDLVGPPSPRLGHTLTMVDGQAFVIGGRGGPTQSLNDVWVLNMSSENKWMLLECFGSMFLPRHRHAAAAVGSNIYVFGGLNGEEILSDMNVLDTATLQWNDVSIQGEWPSARHSHSLISNGSILYMFGGYDGKYALGDLFSFDTITHRWKKEITLGKAPSPRFSHSMFVYKDYLGILGGCPLSQNNQVMYLLNLKDNIWVHISTNSISRNLWVRSSTCIIGDELMIIGGGTSCYAFGTKFNEPMKINLQMIDSIYGMSHIKGNKTRDQVNGKYFVFKVEKKYAKIAKDILKKYGWLDLSRKVQRSLDDHHILLPVGRNFCSLYEKRTITSSDTCDGFCQQEIVAKKAFSLNNVSHTAALGMLVSCGGSVLGSDKFCSKNLPKPPQKLMKEAVCSLLMKKGISLKLLEQLPMRWERLGDILVLPVNSFRDPIWDSIGCEVWPIVAKSLGAQRLARQGRILATGTRDSTLELLIGDDGWVKHQENGILYSFDATKCMFSSGNHSEKLRIAHLDCAEETVVDLFAGIGYFTLPFLVKANAKLVYACEWNPHAIKALKYNVNANHMADRCIILEGDNRVTAPKGVADRVCLGLLPSSECSWATAVKALIAKGGVLHVHENVKDSEEKSWLDYLHNSISSIAQSQGLNWDVRIEHIERVKWYAPHIRHLVVDLKCQQL